MQTVEDLSEENGWGWGPSFKIWKYDSRLSLKAKAIFYSLYEDVQYGENPSIEGMADGNLDGLASIRSGVAELVERGYVKRTRQNVNGRFVWGWKLDPNGEL